MKEPPALHLFEGFGVEMEYMIVDRETLAVRPIADQLIQSMHGSLVSEFELESHCISNELVNHVIEVKTNGPVPTLDSGAFGFSFSVATINHHLEAFGAQLMPTAMHPLMDPRNETRLWMHESNAIYETYNRIFDCRGHGWSNLQSTHLNLPFSGDREFRALHNAIRLLLPLLPALAASSPLQEGKASPWLDARMEHYRNNAVRIPCISGDVVPEAIASEAEYHKQILAPIYAAIRPHDPESILQEEWLNSRGAIARFERNTIEIRVLDVQETPLADLAICVLIQHVLQALIDETWSSWKDQSAYAQRPLVELFHQSIQHAELAPIADEAFLRLLGYPGKAPCTANRLWMHLLEATQPWSEPDTKKFVPILTQRIEAGTVSSCILRRLGKQWKKNDVLDVYHELCDCLASGHLFLPAP